MQAAKVKTTTTKIITDFLASLENKEENKEKLEKFVNKFFPRIRELVERLRNRYRLQDADIDDLAGKILLRIVERELFDSFVFQSKEKFEAWLARVVRREVLDFLKAKNRNKTVVDHSAAQEKMNEDAEELFRGTCFLFAEFMTRIEQNEPQMELRVGKRNWQIFDRYAKGRKASDIAGELSTTEAAVWTSISRTKRKLREALADFWQ